MSCTYSLIPVAIEKAKSSIAVTLWVNESDAKSLEKLDYILMESEERPGLKGLQGVDFTGINGEVTDYGIKTVFKGITEKNNILNAKVTVVKIPFEKIQTVGTGGYTVKVKVDPENIPEDITLSYESSGVWIYGKTDTFFGMIGMMNGKEIEVKRTDDGSIFFFKPTKD